jgi:hypothetical protein
MDILNALAVGSFTRVWHDDPHSEFSQLESKMAMMPEDCAVRILFPAFYLAAGFEAVPNIFPRRRGCL